ncbi:MAG: hypothetical protein EBV01_11175 [Betaproteobacteria bacterium]|nr:hypothetical protein [Betaproteobacteria bacterium]NBP38544.1 hypothetical protein [Betaproteobacteria bacterium]NBQ79320.1 hypothetical protein [Betaproteobacteria bacterium]NBQ96233.1 hypothetical protein [Betaproteobacteria bacterium]NCV14545.1 hypothetical protein [Betaproteobacteria bacterium]
MKKFLVIFMLVMLPLQFSWAAVAGYCQHEGGATAKHLGHHSHDHKSATSESADNDSSMSAALDHDCATCHLACSVALTSYANVPTMMVAQDHHSQPHASPSRTLAERPERPQWLALA